MATLDALVTELKEIATLGSIGGLLGWDEQVLLQPKGVEFRSQQAALIARMTHERFTSKQIGDWLGELLGDKLDGDAAVVVREAKRDYDRATKLPTSLVEEISRTTTLAQAAWVEARKANDYARFSPWLIKVLDLRRQEAACIGSPSGNAYDALLDQYEPGETVASLVTLFDDLKPRLAKLVEKILTSGKRSPAEILRRDYPSEKQQALSKFAAEKIGYDFAAGRIDVSVHPFCSGIAPGDTRITTRYNPNYFGDALFGVLHETGHALYEQGLPKDQHFGTALAEAASLGVHESQSRLWENLVGRSAAFWKWLLPKTRETFPGALADVSDEQWLAAVNDVRPTFIRVDSDEATYNLHIALRFDLERKMLSGELEVAAIPTVWNETFKQYFGLDVPDAARGCLQDVHWSAGLIGYFPTYTLGNLLAAQLYEAAERDLGNLDDRHAAGEFAPLLGWLRTNVHHHGRRFSGRQLCERATGSPLSADALMRHLERKAAKFHGV